MYTASPTNSKLLYITQSPNPPNTVLLKSHHRRLCRVKTMLAMYLKYHKAGLIPTTPVISTAISLVKMSIGHKSFTNLRSEMIFHTDR